MPINPEIALQAGKAQQPQQSPMAFLGDLMTMRTNMQSIRSNEQKLRASQNELDDDDAVRSVLQHHVSTSPNGEPDYDNVILQLGQMGRGTAALKFQDKVFEWNKQRAEEYKTNAELARTKLETASRIAQGINDQASFDRALPQIKALTSPEVTAMLGTRYDPAVISQVIDQGRSASDMLAAQRDIFSRAAAVIEEQRNAAKDKQEWAAKQPKFQEDWTGMASGMLSLSKSQEDWDNGMRAIKLGMNGLPTDTINAVVSKFGDKFSSAAVERARMLGMSQADRSQERDRNIDNARQAAADKAEDKAVLDLTPESKRMLAENFAHTGQMPAFGMGAQATKLRTEVYNIAGELYAGLSLPEQRAAYDAYKTSLSRLQGMYSNVSAFETMAIGNLDVFLKEAEKAIDTGSPLINKPLRSFSKQVLGSPQMAAYEMAQSTVLPEFTRILNSATLAGVITNDQRKEIDEKFASGITLKQLKEVARVLLTDAENRRKGYEGEMSELRKLMRQPPAGTTPAPMQATSTGYPANYSGRIQYNGKTYDVTTDKDGKITSQKEVK